MPCIVPEKTAYRATAATPSPSANLLPAVFKSILGQDRDRQDIDIPAKSDSLLSPARSAHLGARMPRNAVDAHAPGMLAIRLRAHHRLLASPEPVPRMRFPATGSIRSRQGKKDADARRATDAAAYDAALRRSPARRPARDVRRGRRDVRGETLLSAACGRRKGRWSVTAAQAAP